MVRELTYKIKKGEKTTLILKDEWVDGEFKETRVECWPNYRFGNENCPARVLEWSNLNKRTAHGLPRIDSDHTTSYSALNNIKHQYIWDIDDGWLCET